jgi:hypothetical protein
MDKTHTGLYRRGNQVGEGTLDMKKAIHILKEML